MQRAYGRLNQNLVKFKYSQFINEEVQPSWSDDVSLWRFIGQIQIFYNFLRIFSKESLGTVRLSRDGRVTANIHIFFWFKTLLLIDLSSSWNEENIKNFFKPLIKGNIKIQSSSRF